MTKVYFGLSEPAAASYDGKISMVWHLKILKIFIIAVKENMIDIFYFGPLILKTVELCLKKVSACYRDRDLFNMAKMTAKHQKLCDPLYAVTAYLLDILLTQSTAFNTEGWIEREEK